MSNKKYWKGLEELKQGSEVVDNIKNREFLEYIPVEDFLGNNQEALNNSNTSRRDFLKYVGFSTLTASLAACEGPVVKSIPYVIKPEEITPGVPDYYASIVNNGEDLSSVLIKNREGRPIKIDPNPLAHDYGSVNARIVASILSLYDSDRMKGPKKLDDITSWKTLNKDTKEALERAKTNGKKSVILTTSLVGPSTKSLIKKLKNHYGVEHITYDAISESAAVTAFERKFGIKALLSYDLSKASIILSFGADILGDWQGGGFERSYSSGRYPKDGHMSRHIQIESNMSITGANADERIPASPTQQKFALINLYNILSGENLPSQKTSIDDRIKDIAQDIKKAKKSSFIAVHSDEVSVNLIAMAINELLNSEVVSKTPRYVRTSTNDGIEGLVSDMNQGNVEVLITSYTNPVYTLPNASEFIEGLKKVDFSVGFAQKEDETVSLMKYKAPQSHFLESWGDINFSLGAYGLMQPVIRPLFDSLQLEDCMLSWLGSTESFYDYLKRYWEENILDSLSWNTALHDGILIKNEKVNLSDNSIDLHAEASKIKPGKGTELQLYGKIGMGNGYQANNPWLQEMPDPITRTTWDNYLTISIKQANELGLKNWNVSNGALNGDKVDLTVDGLTIKGIPVIVQPGQAYKTVGLSFGYGRKKAIKSPMEVGVNAYPLYKNFNSVQTDVSIEKSSDGHHEFACIQLHNTLMGRGDVVRETTLDSYINKSKSQWNPEVALDTHKGVKNVNEIDLWDSVDRSIGHHFKLSIDLNTCTGCGSCIIACQVENNIPVVGKEEMRNSRDMHWLRIDRYYSSKSSFEEDTHTKDNASGLAESIAELTSLEDASENPEVVFQPVMCQHCNHAPCETVCPVAATSHGKQGQNQMAYNRCVGTRYCANNCPYKVRRFNWFNYSKNDAFDFNMNDDLGRMVLNPDVVVRSRGVMEKCSMCIQTTQYVILEAKREGRKLVDEDFKNSVACASCCPTDSMVFGDVNNPDSTIAQKEKDDRRYYLLEHVGTKPNVMYQVKVRNKKV
ncbi:TAT-variant-translocated molybdopterin oxidoreductase [Ichthyobacterium seriolicida]|nr:TAT-variant-translocated molybdopterin oxidoreductase [Ichthyobacterium seriolicida]